MAGAGPEPRHSRLHCRHRPRHPGALARRQAGAAVNRARVRRYARVHHQQPCSEEAPTMSNLPPGCSVRDIPGNRPEDQAAEALAESMYDALDQLDLQLPEPYLDVLVEWAMKLHSDAFAAGYAAHIAAVAEARQIKEIEAAARIRGGPPLELSPAQLEAINAAAATTIGGAPRLFQASVEANIRTLRGDRPARDKDVDKAIKAALRGWPKWGPPPDEEAEPC